MDNKKEAVVTTTLSDNKSLTKDVDKGTDELEYMKESVVSIRRNCSDKFEGWYKGYTGWFNINSESLRRIFILLNQTSIKEYL